MGVVTSIVPVVFFRGFLASEFFNRIESRRLCAENKVVTDRTFISFRGAAGPKRQTRLFTTTMADYYSVSQMKATKRGPHNRSLSLILEAAKPFGIAVAAIVSPKRRSVLLIFSIALLVRMIALGILQHWPVTPTSGLWRSGPEIVNIAESIASGKGFSSPYGVPSGPTAWIPPVYPYLVAAVFSGAGIRSNLSAFLILTAQAIFSSFVCFPLYWTGLKVTDEKTAEWATWFWALFPYEFLIPVLFIWETTLSALLMSLLCYFCIDVSTGSRRRWVGVGVLSGIAALTNTALISVVPFLLVWGKVPRPPWRLALRPIFIAGLAFTITVAPWSLRNWFAFKSIVPIRSNFGHEFWLGNHPGGTGRTLFGLSPSENQGELRRYAQVGEIEYVRQHRSEAVRFVISYSIPFLRGVAYRFFYWWLVPQESGLMFSLYRVVTLGALAGVIVLWRTKIRSADSVIIAICIYPIVYYVTDVYARYRYPIESLMIVLGAVAASKCMFFIRRTTTRPMKCQAFVGK